MKAGAALRRALSVALVGAAVLFLGLAVHRNAGALRAYDWQPNALRLGLSVVAQTLVLLWGIFVWQRVLVRFHGGAAPLHELGRIWFLSGVAKYIPGKVWQFVAVADLARRAGLSRVLILTSMLVHVGFTLLAAMVVSAATLPLRDFGIPLDPAAALAIAAVAAVLLAHPLVLNTALRLVPRALHRDVLAWNGRWADGLLLLGLNLVSWAVSGVAFWVFVTSLVALPASTIVPIAGVNALSFVAGYVVILAPAGLGVREVTMKGLLQPLVGAASVVVAILSRLWTIAAELLGAVLVVLWARRMDGLKAEEG